jgi:high-affinity nickel-transport protein
MSDPVSALLAISTSIPVLAALGGVGVLGAALALGVRHGIDWDHIAAITDITSTTSTSHADDVLTKEPGIFLTDESQPHAHPESAGSTLAAVAAGSGRAGGATDFGMLVAHATLIPATQGAPAGAHAAAPAAVWSGRAARLRRGQAPSLLLGTMYALGHGSVVLILGALAITANEFLPAWIDPIMERVVGVTLLFLGVYLFYSLYRYFRGGQEFHIRSRWMLVFAAVRRVYDALRARVFGTPRQHVHTVQQYGVPTAYGIGLIHGIGAETGTQVLVITAAAGAASKGMGLAALVVFIVGLLISNSIVTVMTTFGFASSRQRQTFYIAAGFFAAIFSLVLGLVFVTRSVEILPALDPYFRWIGGPE